MARQYSTGSAKKVARAMRERKAGTLKIGKSSKKVKSRKQAIAIGLSEARKEGLKVPKKAAASSRTPVKKAATKTGSKVAAAKKKTAAKTTKRAPKKAAKKTAASRSRAAHVKTSPAKTSRAGASKARTSKSRISKAKTRTRTSAKSPG